MRGHNGYNSKMNVTHEIKVSLCAEKTKINVPKNTKRKISSKRNNQTQNIKSV